ncbi:hypothetical protein CBP31_10840 [Oceanisphaera profunda]|uniref:HTH araC/xylS-type domain-containing protein n=1 Tax=Oceanisphaera profunda TaxID=1416627 RepID=A0A1Y0D774_9GAMM|nr:hypothetical protein [Oceanisphaera profunda]ART83057.1 hypothetical protein CBP31_10840 [Oceanisphaera profunda]
MTTAAQHSIHYQLLEPAHLIPGKRHRYLKGLLFIVHQGAGLLQLGPHFYVLGKDDAVFLPADTLFTWHTVAHSRISRLAFSPRLVQPRQAGLLTAAPLLLAGAARLANWPSTHPANAGHELDWQGAYGRLCRVLHDELQHLTPQPLTASSKAASLTKLQQIMSANLVNFALTKPQEAEFQARFNMAPADFKRQAALLTILRELAKTADLAQLVQSYGFSSVAEFEQACAHWLAS